MNTKRITPELYDLAIVGGGPGGLAAAINASSEGLKTALVDSKDTLGGQVIESAAVRNYPGFPKGVSGKEMMALFTEQASNFKSAMLRPVRALALRTVDDIHMIDTDDSISSTIAAKAVILAIGLSYIRLGAIGVSDFLGRGVSYGMPNIDELQEQHCFCVVGGANSAGQAAVHLSGRENCKVYLIVRGDEISNSMSKYLHDEIRQRKNIHVMLRSEVVEVKGNSHIEQVVVRTQGMNKLTTLPANNLCVFIGARPKNDWLPDTIEKSSRGFICTGRRLTLRKWPLKKQRPPFAFETSVPGIFACGDVQEGSVKRITTTVGAAVVAVTEVQEYLRTFRA